MYAKYEASIPCSYRETGLSDLSAENEHFDHVHVCALAFVEVAKQIIFSSPKPKALVQLIV